MTVPICASFPVCQDGPVTSEVGERRRAKSAEGDWRPQGPSPPAGRALTHSQEMGLF